MMICEVLTNAQLVSNYMQSDNIAGMELSDAITYYLNEKPGTWNLKTVSNDSNTYSFFWTVPDNQSLVKGKKKNGNRK